MWSNRTKIIKWSKRLQEKINKKPVIYLVGYWAHAGIREYPFAGKFVKSRLTREYVPLVYVYNDCNGSCSRFEIIPVDEATIGYRGYCFSKTEAELLSEWIEQKYKQN